MLLPYIAPTTSFRKEIEIKKSLFIADIIPIQTIEEAVTTLASKKKSLKMLLTIVMLIVSAPHKS